MSTPAYATLDDLAQWVDDDLPITAPNVLRSAALAVADRIQLAYYAVDQNYLPTNTALAAALRDATCAQAAWLIANDIDVLGGNSSASVERVVKIGSASIEYADADTAAKSRTYGVNGLCTEAERIIGAAGFHMGVRSIPSWAFWGTI